jgi:tRNA A37 methylthiotransferase MiaB
VEDAPKDGSVHLTGRSRAHTLVHLEGRAELVGRLVDVRIEHAGPYSLRGALA